MKSTTNFETFDFIQYMSMDVLEELNDLDEKIEAGNGKEIRDKYNGINNLLNGIDYTMDYIANEDDRESLRKAVANMRELLKSRYNICKTIVEKWNEAHLK